MTWPLTLSLSKGIQKIDRSAHSCLVERFFIEKIRVNVAYDFGGMQVTQAEIIAVMLILLGGIGIWWFRKRSLRVS